jgi:hypothetical protein
MLTLSSSSSILRSLGHNAKQIVVEQSGNGVQKQ